MTDPAALVAGLTTPLAIHNRIQTIYFIFKISPALPIKKTDPHPRAVRNGPRTVPRWAGEGKQGNKCGREAVVFAQ